ncbi:MULTISPECIES: CPBP family intramembrane glutamic endopeptidase [unclassified Streptomyces]|uniref:CPBP family intramembrane glutamic endopeptidase n=1 Tax=unclassified Streptomyces TaxID=2593676 RepID=UPI001BED26B6|nr:MULTISPECIES: CPBP family intramembrane glutamic endopeptidase [unclassified Streptomyces]MBT2405762.1 CPBP family intramembrane metalloprotease [Streptomyces sp. ISL-21]MBT2610342.1 CPBP family intramembrane metalloprotease [Streptomyces sp. ISL-87]
MGTVDGVEPAGRGGVWGAAGVFTAVAFVAAGALGAVQPGTGVPAEVVQLTQFGPAVGVGAVALHRWRRTRELLRGGVGRSPRRAVAILGTAALIVALTVLVHGVASGGAGFTPPGALHHPFVLIAAAQLVGACGEEIGWRCFLQPLLRARFGALVSSVTVGAVWGAWHVPVFAQGPACAAGFLVATVAMSVVLGVALDGTGGPYRLLLAGGFHTLVNLGLLLFMDEESGAVLPMLCFGLSCLVVALAWAGRHASAPAAAPVPAAAAAPVPAPTTLHGT